MYSHLTPSVAAERTDDDLHFAALRRRSAEAPSVAGPAGVEDGRPARVPWPRRVGRRSARPASA